MPRQIGAMKRPGMAPGFVYLALDEPAARARLERRRASNRRRCAGRSRGVGRAQPTSGCCRHRAPEALETALRATQGLTRRQPRRDQGKGQGARWPEHAPPERRLGRRLKRWLRWLQLDGVAPAEARLRQRPGLQLGTAYRRLAPEGQQLAERMGGRLGVASGLQDSQL